MRAQFRVSHIFHLLASRPIQLVLLISFAAQLNVWNKNNEESSHDFLLLLLVYLSCDLWLSACVTLRVCMCVAFAFAIAFTLTHCLSYLLSFLSAYGGQLPFNALLYM